MSTPACFSPGPQAIASFQLNALTSGLGVNPVLSGQAFPASGTPAANQLWSPEVATTSPSLTIFLTHPSSPASGGGEPTFLTFDEPGTGANGAQYKQAIVSSAASVFELVCVGEGSAALLLAEQSDMALTAWNVSTFGDASTATGPITFETYDPSRPEQIWFLNFKPAADNAN